MTDRIGAARYGQRLDRAQAAVAAADSSGLLVGVGPELEWLTGYVAHGGERLNLLVVPAAGEIGYISPRLEAPAALAAPGFVEGRPVVRTWDETDDPFTLVPTLLTGREPRRLHVSDGLRAQFVLGLQAALPAAAWGLASELLAPLRQVKDPEEVALLRSAARAADRAIERIIHGPLVGRTEADVAGSVRDALIEEGHDTAEFWIVASGPNTASPHHEPGDRVIGAGEPLLLDIGGRRAGYFSDITRTVWIAGDDGSGPDETFATIYRLTEAGQAAGRGAVRPGVTFESIDAAARQVITDGGYGAAFFHRLGHGIGVEVHEEPYVVEGNRRLTVEGNTFSCEPGIYLEGRYGVRIEDAVVCTAGGGESLNEAPRELRVVSGR